MQHRHKTLTLVYRIVLYIAASFAQKRRIGDNSNLPAYMADALISDPCCICLLFSCAWYCSCKPVKNSLEPFGFKVRGLPDRSFFSLAVACLSDHHITPDAFFSDFFCSTQELNT